MAVSPLIKQNQTKPEPSFFAVCITDEAVSPPTPLLQLDLRVFCWILHITTGPLMDIDLQGHLV